MSLLSSVFIGLFLFNISTYAGDDWCIITFVNPPCNSAPGNCTINFDGSLGGFVAKTAYVESVMVNGLSRNRSSIGLNVSICDYAQVTGDALVAGAARVSGTAWIFGNARVDGNTQITGNAQVYEDARVNGDTRVGGDSKISGNDLISNGNYGF